VQFEVTMRDGKSHHVEAAYLEVAHGPTSSSYALLGPLPGYPSAILAVFPTDLVLAIMPAAQPSRPPAQKLDRQRVERGPMADERAPVGAESPMESIV